MTGTLAASGLSKHVLLLENTIRLCQYLYDRLKFLRPGVRALIRQAAAADEFRELTFLKVCAEKVEAGGDFPICWKEAVAAFWIFDREESKIVQSLGGVLGASDLESQLSALEYARELLEARILAVRDYAAKHKKLYRTLGVLSGLGIAVVLL